MSLPFARVERRDFPRCPVLTASLFLSLSDYDGRMPLAAKLLTLIAVLLMPFGMTAVPAAAMQHHAASMPMQHCPEQAPKPAGKAGFVECTMACSAALPAMGIGRDQQVLIVCVPAEASAVKQLHGLHPETATPPPKRS